MTQAIPEKVGYADIFQTIKDPLIAYLLKRVLGDLVAKFNWLGWLLPNWIATQVLYIVIKYGFVETKLVFIAIDKHEDRQEFDQAKDKYDQAKESASEEEVKKREQELIDAFRSHVKFG